jgi:hypothetical protein
MAILPGTAHYHNAVTVPFVTGVFSQRDPKTVAGTLGSKPIRDFYAAAGNVDLRA